MNYSKTITHFRELVIINSIRYYHLDAPKLGDSQFDTMCKSLLIMQEMTEGHTDYLDKYFEDFDGSTGFHLVTDETIDMFKGEL